VKKEKKTRYFSIRLSEEESNKFATICERTSLKKSEMFLYLIEKMYNETEPSRPLDDYDYSDSYNVFDDYDE